MLLVIQSHLYWRNVTCLFSVDLQLNWNNKEQEFVGFGYKAYQKYLFDSIGRIKNTAVNKGVKLSKSKWMEATADGNGNEYLLMSGTYYNDSSIRYFPGFHIFEDIDSARGYGLRYFMDFKLVKVIYKNIVASGTNYAGLLGYKRCIVARNMKILEVIK